MMCFVFYRPALCTRILALEKEEEKKAHQMFAVSNTQLFPRNII